MIFINRSCAICLSVLIFLPLNAMAATSAELWATLIRGESVAIMRHAIAPGGGDPANFEINNCSTQRNLSQQGQHQAQAIGELYRAKGVADADIYSSQWCRCLDTASGLNFKQPIHLPALNSFFQDRTTAFEKTESLEKWIRSRLEKTDVATMLPAILVTHQVNITSLTNVFPASGEIVFVTVVDDAVVVMGSVVP